MGRSDYCCVVGCRNKRAQATAVTLYRFPDNPPERRKLWMENIAVARGQPNWTPKNSTRICAAHFVGGKKSNKPDAPNYVPTLFGVNVATPVGRTRKSETVAYYAALNLNAKKARSKKTKSEDSEWTPQGKQVKQELVPHWDDATGTTKWMMVKKESPFFAESLPTMVPLSRPGCSSYDSSASPRYETSMHSPVGMVRTAYDTDNTGDSHSHNTSYSSLVQDSVECKGPLELKLDIPGSNSHAATTSSTSFEANQRMADISAVDYGRDSSQVAMIQAATLETSEGMLAFENDYDGGNSHTQQELTPDQPQDSQTTDYEHNGEQADIMHEEHSTAIARNSHENVENGQGVGGMVLVNKGSSNDPVFVVMPTAAEQTQLSPQPTRTSSRKRKAPQKYDPSEFDTEMVWQDEGDSRAPYGPQQSQEEDESLAELSKRLRRMVSEQRDVHLSELLQLHEENKYLQDEVMQVKQMQDFREENKRLKKLVGQQRDVHLLELQQLNEELQQTKQAWQAEVQEKNEIIKKLKSAAFCLDVIKGDDNLFNFYTGFQNYDTFKALTDYLRPHSNSIYRQPDDKHSTHKACRSRSLSFDEELFMVCVRLKAGLLTQDISHRFNISAGTCSRIFRHWVPFLKEHLQLLYGTETPPLHSVQVMKTKVYHIFDGGLPQTLDDMEETLHVVCAFLSSFDSSLVDCHNMANDTAHSQDALTHSALSVT